MTEQTPSCVSLPVRLDRSAAIDFKSTLDEHAGQDLQIDGSGNEVVGGLGLQVLHAAKCHWESQGLKFEIIEPAESLAAALSWFDHTGQNDTEGFV